MQPEQGDRNDTVGDGDATIQPQALRPESTAAPHRPGPSPEIEAARRDLAGEVLGGKYRVLRLLGEGGFGSVYEAVDEMLGASVAVKVLTPAAAGMHDALQQFLGEARLVTTLDHPNIVRWITFDRTPDGLHFFVMELLRGKELSDVLKRQQRLPWQRVVPILLQMLSALRAAHFLPDGRSLLHLDLKPRNVFVIDGDPEQIKVIDFGISQHVGAAARSAVRVELRTSQSLTVEELGETISTRAPDSPVSAQPGKPTVQRALGGSLLYASPEHCRHLNGEPDIVELDGRSDLYSFGIIAYQMLAGRVPWDCKDPASAIRAHLEIPPPKLSKLGVKLPRGLEQFVDRCLAKNRDARYRDVREAYHALDRVAHPPAKWPAVVAVLALVAMVVVWQLWPRTRPVEVTVATKDDAVYFGPTKLVQQLPVTSLLPELAEQPARWVVDLQSDVDAMPGWTAKLERVDGQQHVRLTAPASDVKVNKNLHLRFGAGSFAQFSKQLRVVYLTPAAYTVGQAGVRGAESKVVDPVGADFEIPIQVAEQSFIDKVHVSLGSDQRSATPNLNRTAGANLIYSLPLKSFSFTAADGAKMADFMVTVVDRAGNEQTRSVPVQIDARPLTFAPELDAPPDLGIYVLYPKSMPMLRWKSNRAVPRGVTVTARNGQQPVEITHEPIGDGIQLKLPLSEASYDGVIEIDANDLQTVFHADESRGRQTTTLKYRYETSAVTVVVTPKDPEGRPLAMGRDDNCFVTNRDSITLALAREAVAVSVEVERKHGGTVTLLPSVDLRLEGREVNVPIVASGKHELEVRGYRYRFNAPRTEKPEFVRNYVVVRDTGVPELRLTTKPTLVAGPVDATAPWFGVEVGDDSEEPVRLEVVLAGPSPSRGVLTLPAGPLRQETVRWEQLDVDPTRLEDGTYNLVDGTYNLSLTAVDAASNRSATVSFDEFVIARSGPVLVLKSAIGNTWVAKTGNTFEVEIDASDNNGTKTVECHLLSELGEPMKWLVRKSDNATLQGARWVGEFQLPRAWSGKPVKVTWRGCDLYDNWTKEQSFSTNLPVFEVTPHSRIGYEMVDMEVDIQPMRRVKGESNYAFGGRTEQDERSTFKKHGLDAARGRTLNKRVEIDDYYLDENEVTVGQYGDFLAAAENGYRNVQYWTDKDCQGKHGEPTDDRHGALKNFVAKASDPRLPMTGIDWYEAAAYARWVEKRLPTVREWEYAVRGGAAYRLYSWARDEEPAKLELNVDRNTEGGPWVVDRGDDTTPTGVGGYGEGIRNLCSNVSEWTASSHSDGAYMETAGASYERTAFHFLITTPKEPAYRGPTIGFRCATSVDAALEHPPGRIHVLPKPKAR